MILLGFAIVLPNLRAEISERDKMKINIFEGARRLTKLIAVIWVLGMSFYAFTEKGYVYAYFRVDLPDGVPIRMTEQEHCDKNDATEYLSSQYTSKGSDVSVTLCFKSDEWEDITPTKPAPVKKAVSFDEWKAMGEPSAQQPAQEVQQPTKKVPIVDELPPGFEFVDKLPPGFVRESEFKKQKKIAANFKFSKADEEWADGVAWSERLEKIKTSATVTIGGLAFLWIFSWCVGWIVRGFAGIPSGQDFKS